MDYVSDMLRSLVALRHPPSHYPENRGSLRYAENALTLFFLFPIVIHNSLRTRNHQCYLEPVVMGFLWKHHKRRIPTAPFYRLFLIFLETTPKAETPTGSAPVACVDVVPLPPVAGCSLRNIPAAVL